MKRLSLVSSDRIWTRTLPPEELTLGAAADNDWQCRVPGISRRHARIVTDGDGVIIVDLESKNGLVIEGERRSEVRLGVGQSVRLGGAVLTLEEVSSGDVLEALALPTVESTTASDDTVSHQSVRGSTLVPVALRFVRRLEEAGGQALLTDVSVFEGAREALDSQGLVLWRSRVGDREVALVRSVGRPAGDGLWSRLGEALSQDGPPRVVRLGVDAGSCLAVACKGGELHLCATFDDEVEEWQVDLFTYLAAKIGFEGRRRSALSNEDWTPGRDLRFPSGLVVGESDSMRSFFEQLRTAVSTRLDVLLLGETGVGKEVFARTIHDSGPTRGEPFLPVNCAAIPAELLESQLFGVERGVATGVERRAGLFAEAGAGTVLLDEVGEMPLTLQAKLLRVLQEREVLPVGGVRPRKVAARVISASNRDLAALARAGEFRADLYYRLRRLEFRVPSLRERREDIPGLVLELTRRAASRYEKRIAGVSRKALSLLTEYPWPGNVRELETEIEKAVLGCRSGGRLESGHFAELLAWSNGEGAEPPLPDGSASLPSRSGSRRGSSSSAPPPRATLAEQVEAVERRAIADALERTGGNKTRAAELLGITRQGLNLKLRRFRRAAQEKRTEKRTEKREEKRAERSEASGSQREG